MSGIIKTLKTKVSNVEKELYPRTVTAAVVDEDSGKSVKELLDEIEEKIDEGGGGGSSSSDIKAEDVYFDMSSFDWTGEDWEEENVQFAIEVLKGHLNNQYSDSTHISLGSYPEEPADDYRYIPIGSIFTWETDNSLYNKIFLITLHTYSPSDPKGTIRILKSGILNLSFEGVKPENILPHWETIWNGIDNEEYLEPNSKIIIATSGEYENHRISLFYKLDCKENYRKYLEYANSSDYDKVDYSRYIVTVQLITSQNDSRYASRYLESQKYSKWYFYNDDTQNDLVSESDPFNELFEKGYCTSSEVEYIGNWSEIDIMEPRLVSQTLPSETNNDQVATTAFVHNVVNSGGGSAEIPNLFTSLEIDGTTLTPDSAEDTLILEGSNITLTPDETDNKIVIGVTKDNVISALGYEPVYTNENDVTKIGSTLNFKDISSIAANSTNFVFDKGLIPKATKSYNLGSSSMTWNEIHSYRTQIDYNEKQYGYLGVRTIGSNNSLGDVRLVLGNQITQGNADNAMGSIFLYGKNGVYASLLAEQASSTENEKTSNTTNYLPRANGELGLSDYDIWGITVGEYENLMFAGVYGTMAKPATGGNIQTVLVLNLPINLYRTVPNNAVITISKLECNLVSTATGNFLLGSEVKDVTQYISQVNPRVNQGMIRVVLENSEGWGVSGAVIGNCTVSLKITSETSTVNENI